MSLRRSTGDNYWPYLKICNQSLGVWHTVCGTIFVAHSVCFTSMEWLLPIIQSGGDCNAMHWAKLTNDQLQAEVTKATAFTQKPIRNCNLTPDWTTRQWSKLQEPIFWVLTVDLTDITTSILVPFSLLLLSSLPGCFCWWQSSPLFLFHFFIFPSLHVKAFNFFLVSTIKSLGNSHLPHLAELMWEST